MSSFVKLNLDDRVVTLRGTFPNSKVREYIAKNHNSRLWREIRFYIKEFYPNSTLLSVEISGDANHVAIESYSPVQGEPLKAWGLHI